MKPLKQGSKEWEKGIVKDRLDEHSLVIQTSKGQYRRNRVDLKKTHEPPLTVHHRKPSVPRPHSTPEITETTTTNQPESVTTNDTRKSQSSLNFRNHHQSKLPIQAATSKKTGRPDLEECLSSRRNLICDFIKC